VKSGILPGNQPALRYPMQPYAPLSDSEVKAIFAYLKTVLKIKNKSRKKSLSLKPCPDAGFL
jgi:hypothetical protein